MKKRTFDKMAHLLDGPLLEQIAIELPLDLAVDRYTFSLPIVQTTKMIDFTEPVTFFVGENGTGKSTFLEAIAHKAGFGSEGGSKNIHFATIHEIHRQAARLLADCMNVTWRCKPYNGYFLRAESFFNVANYIDTIGPDGGYLPYGGKSLHEQSHGESFMSFFNNRLGSNGLFVLDEPEAALSPQRQLTLLAIIHEACKKQGNPIYYSDSFSIVIGISKRYHLFMRFGEFNENSLHRNGPL